MARNIAIPKLGLTMTEATLVEWKVKEGEQVQGDQPILTIEMDKAPYDLPSIAAGVVHRVAKEGDVVQVGGLVGVLAESADEYAKVAVPPSGTAQATPAKVLAGEPSAPQAAVQAAPAAKGPARVSPVARRLAEEHGVDLSALTGTGPGGAIQREDVEQAIAAKKAAPATPAVPVASPTAALAGQAVRRVKKVVPLKGIRGVIARHMHQSLQQTAQMTQCGDIDMHDLIRLRNALVARQEQLGARITYTDLFVYITARALKQHPLVNASIVGNEIHIWEDMNIGVAVYIEGDETTAGLVVPVVRNADQKSIVQLHNEIAALAEKARTHKLLPDDMASGTFTFTNLGSMGVGGYYGTPIINYPEAAILQVGEMADRPVVVNGQVAVRPIISYSFTIDHRVVDGIPAGRFMKTVKELVEHPAALAFG